MNVVECPELRELLVYIGNDTIDDDDILHRTKITQMLFEEHQAMRQQIMAELRVCYVTPFICGYSNIPFL